MFALVRLLLAEAVVLACADLPFKAAAEPRRLDVEHEDVRTNVTAISAEVESDWQHDFEILEPIVAQRGYNTTGIKKLCQLPGVYCDTGFRRRVPTYASKLMDPDWVGREYQVILQVPDPSIRVEVNASLFSLKRVGYFEVRMNAGAMPAGIEKLTTARMIWLEGNRTHGLEGPLPGGFWSMQPRMLLLASMGPQFTGNLESDLPMCQHLDYRLYLYRLPGFTGDVSALKACNKLTDTVEVFLNPMLGGNAWEAVAGFDSLKSGGMLLWSCNFTGSFPDAVGGTDRWSTWCQTRTGEIKLRVDQLVQGPIAQGLAHCSNIFSRFQAANALMTGPFPLNFSLNQNLSTDGIRIWGNRFTGPFPDIPPHIDAIDMTGNRFSGNIPSSWFNASITTLDLSDCNLSGPLPDIPKSVTKLTLKGNHFKGPAPQSWFNAVGLELLDLSANQIEGPPFTWGLAGADPSGNFDVTTFLSHFKDPPAWPLQTLKISDNPLNMSAGFLMSMLSQYQLTTLHAANCGLTNFVSTDDFLANRPNAGGGLSERPGAAAYSNLEELDLSSNYITNFGYNDRDGSASLCWQGNEWTTRLPKLKVLTLKNSTLLTKLHPRCYGLDLLDVTGASRLVKAAPLQAQVSDCSNMVGSAVSTCEGETWPVCLHATSYFSSLGDGSDMECASVATNAGKVLVTPETFDPAHLCRTSARSPAPDKDNTLLIVLVVGGVVVLAVGAFFVWYVCIRRRANKQAAQQSSAHAQIQIHMESQSHSIVDADSSTNNITAGLFQDGDLSGILNIGVQEHWAIPAEQLQMIEKGDAVFQGGFGQVQRCLMHGGTEVALKIPRIDDDSNAVSVYKALCNEMRLFRRIRHPNIVLFHGAAICQVNAAPVLCLVLEWASGGDLGGYIRHRRESGQFQADCTKAAGLETVETVIKEHKILEDSARGLLYLHSQEPPILHLDLKPGNILIEAGDPPRGKLADFGLSQILEGANPTKKAGTSSYMAPEVADRKEYGKPADIYSFGGVCYFVALNAHPKPSSSLDENIKALRTEGTANLPVVAEIGCLCMKSEPVLRPGVSDVYQSLSKNTITMPAKGIEVDESTTGGDTKTASSSAHTTKTASSSSEQIATQPEPKLTL